MFISNKVSANLLRRTKKAVKNVMLLECHIANRDLFGKDWRQSQERMVSELLQVPDFHPESWEADFYDSNKISSY